MKTKKPKKKNAEIAINTVVMAALALLAVAILIFILSDKSKDFNTTLSDCENKGGKCNALNCDSVGGVQTSLDCKTEGDVCCLSQCIRRGGTCMQADSCSGEQIYFAGCGDGKVCCK
jgi:hypothetical protein